jgi:hypothetical protein
VVGKAVGIVLMTQIPPSVNCVAIYQPTPAAPIQYLVGRFLSEASSGRGQNGVSAV